MRLNRRGDRPLGLIGACASLFTPYRNLEGFLHDNVTHSDNRTFTQVLPNTTNWAQKSLLQKPHLNLNLRFYEVLMKQFPELFVKYWRLFQVFMVFFSISHINVPFRFFIVSTQSWTRIFGFVWYYLKMKHY